ncbi:MAG: ester cyclase [Flammeovirgaceae bacterium]|nr:ester cyclase [Flammeovirgaceae bacterium]
MSTSKKNREIIISMINKLSGSKKDRPLLEPYIADETLVQHFLYFDSLFPENELLIDELTSEGNRVVLRTRLRGRHQGFVKTIEFPMVFGFEIERQKIIHHWLLADQAKLIEQLQTK